MAALTTFLGGLVPTFLFSRLMLWWVFPRLERSSLGLCAANAISGLIMFVIAGFGGASGDETFSASDGAMFLVPQTIWLVVDLVRYSRRQIFRDWLWQTKR